MTEHETVQRHGYIKFPMLMFNGPKDSKLRWIMGRWALACIVSGTFAGCQTQQSAFDGPDYSEETRQIEKSAMAEAKALGMAQGALGIAGAFDRSGATSLVAMGAGRAARDAMMTRATQRLQAQVDKDEAAFLRKHGVTDEAEEDGFQIPQKAGSCSPAYPDMCRRY